MEAKSPESDTTTVLVALSWSRELGILFVGNGGCGVSCEYCGEELARGDEV